ncbi:hypothetical protein [Embleya sp. NPDC059237]|uniref:hypothetical protein n=1 Tax=Embleya sp. NPDC059237 TaxID=3346784 RepID=UPI0036B41C1F
MARFQASTRPLSPSIHCEAVMEIQEYPEDAGRLALRVGSRVRHVDGHAEMPEGTVVALPVASERVAVVQPLEVGQSPYLCPTGHLVPIDLDAELAGVVRELWRIDRVGRVVEAVPLAGSAARESGARVVSECGFVRGVG